jgi:hypothetical protein
VSCGAPHVVAPELIGWADTSAGGTTRCIWKKQPQTEEEIDRAIMVIEVSEVGCHRYAGTNPQIIRRLSSEYCDNQLAISARLRRKFFGRS